MQIVCLTWATDGPALYYLNYCIAHCWMSLYCIYTNILKKRKSLLWQPSPEYMETHLFKDTTSSVGCFLKGFALTEIRLFIGSCCPILHTSYWRDFIEQHYKAGDRVRFFCHTTHVRTFIEQFVVFFNSCFSRHWDQRFEFDFFSPSVHFEQMHRFPPPLFLSPPPLSSFKVMYLRLGYILICLIIRIRLLWILLMGLVYADCLSEGEKSFHSETILPLNQLSKPEVLSPPPTTILGSARVV